MKKYLVFFIPLVAAVWLLGTVQTTSAVKLKLAPLEYRATLAKGEKQRGFIDVSNPSNEPQKIATSVQAFRQTDDQGSLAFYDNDQLSVGVKLDLDSFELGPHEAVRMYFELDGSKLPTGDVFGAIFLSTQPVTPRAGVGQAIRLGTLLSVVNGTPGARQASITKLDVPFLQFDSKLRGSYTIKNTANPSVSTGFYPTVSMRAALFGESKKQQGKLVFAERSRENDFELTTPPLGIYKVIVGYKDSIQSRYVLVLTPIAIAIVAGLMVATALVYKIIKRYARSKPGRRSKK